MKIIRTSTVPMSLNTFCRGLFKDLQEREGYEVIAISSPDSELAEVEKREGVKTYGVRMERHISPLKDLKSLWQLYKVFHKEKPDMVHSITPKAGLLSMIAAKLARVPVRVHTFTGLVFPTATGLTQKILILTDRLTCACATHISPEGEGVKNDLINYKITKKPLKVLGYGNVRGIDLGYYNPELEEVKKEAQKIREEIGLNTVSIDNRPQTSSEVTIHTASKTVFPNPRRPSTFIAVGRLVGDKGINELVEAFKRLNSEIPDTRLILVGPEERDLDPLLPQTIAEIDSNPAIKAVGVQKDVRPWFAASDCAVLASYREGFPNVVIEAGAMGLPQIVTDINGAREIIIDGKNGVVLKSQNSYNKPLNGSANLRGEELKEKLYEVMKSFIEKPDLVKAMAAEARPLISSRYEQGFVRQCLKDWYKEILNGYAQ